MSTSMIQARPYQEAAERAAEEKLLAHRSSLVVLPTGTGKTVLFAKLARRWADAKKRTLVLAHREELVSQAKKMLERVGLTVGVEMADQRTHRSLFGNDNVVVASVQSMMNRLGRFPADEFGLVVVDEAHHAPAGSYRRILEHFSGAKLLGVTATPDRGDGVAMGKVFESLAYKYEMNEAIRDGWLAPVHAKRITLKGVRLDKVGVVAGDLKASGIEREFTTEEQLAGTAKTILQERIGRTMAFTSTVAHAHALAAAINAQAGSPLAVALDGEVDSDDRRRTLDDWRRGKWEILVNCALFTEGFDEWTVRTVALLRPTKSRALYAQMIGRGTRHCENCPPPAPCACGVKPHLLLLDFTGQSKKHRLVGPADVLGGEFVDLAPPKKKPKAKKGARRDAANVPPPPAREAFATDEEFHQATVKYEAELVDCFKAHDEGAPPAAETAIKSPIPQRLRDKLNNLGVPDADIDRMGIARAAQVMRKCLQRIKAVPRLSSYKQSKLLLKNGVTKAELEGMTFDEASARINQLMEKWRNKSAA